MIRMPPHKDQVGRVQLVLLMLILSPRVTILLLGVGTLGVGTIAEGAVIPMVGVTIVVGVRLRIPSPLPLLSRILPNRSYPIAQR